LAIKRRIRNLVIRDARSKDYDEILKVTLSAFQEHAALMPLHWESYRQGIIARLSDVKPAEQIVAEKDSTIVGTVLLFPVGTVFTMPDRAPITLVYPEVRLLAVAPSAQGRGVGAALMSECIRRTIISGAAALTLHTTDVMHVARRMYEQIGFVRAPELDFHSTKDLIIKGYRLNLDKKTARKVGKAVFSRKSRKT